MSANKYIIKGLRCQEVFKFRCSYIASPLCGGQFKTIFVGIKRSNRRSKPHRHNKIVYLTDVRFYNLVKGCLKRYSKALRFFMYVPII
jgi:hypothetical protein